jgi:DNA-binding NarL/FixJ family response regulator
MTILIIENNDEMRRIIKTIIGDFAERIEERANAFEAVSVYSRYQPDWVLMDIKLPGVDGIAATRKIRAAYPDARVVMVTQYDDGDLRDAALQAGACGYVLKDDLLPLRGLLGGSR